MLTLAETIKTLEDTLRKNGKVVVTERKQDMVTHIIDIGKKHLFRNYKFIENEADQIEATRDIIPLLKIDLGMTEEAFIPLYGGVVLKTIDDHRGYVQQQCKTVCLGTSETCVNLPFLFVDTNHSCSPLTQNFGMSIKRSPLLSSYSVFGSYVI
jgi:hypothetical protein